MKKFICFILVFTFIFILSSNVSAEDTRWKQYLKEFLINIPNLSDKNNEILKDRFLEIYGDTWDIWDYKFCDLDGDGIPEVIIYCGGTTGYRGIYKLYGTSYEFIGALYGGEWCGSLYINTQGKIVDISMFGAWLVEIKNKEIICSPYIDSHGNDLSEIFRVWDCLSEEVMLFPEFDVSDVLDSIKNGTPLEIPKTGDNTMIFYVIFIASIIIKNTKRGIYEHKQQRNMGQR